MATSERRIIDKERFEASVRSFQWLGGAASGATDLDCLIERRGRFLVVEGKRWHSSGLRVPLGQHIALLALTRIPAFTVLLVGEPDRPDVDAYHSLQYGKVGPLTVAGAAFFPALLFDETNREGLRRKVTEWGSQR